MMTARRLNSGSKLAVDIGLAMLQHHAIDAVVYSSRHGELERNYRILHALATGQSVSPTDFAMSVHNSAVGNLTITARRAIVSSSISAGLDTFQQALCEVLSLLQAGYPGSCWSILTAHCRNFTTRRYRTRCPRPYALALVIESGKELQCETRSGSTGMNPPFRKARCSCNAISARHASLWYPANVCCGNGRAHEPPDCPN